MKEGQYPLGVVKGMEFSNIKHITAAEAMDGRHNILKCLANTATDSYTVTLPPVGKFAGGLFYIEATIANSKAVTVEDLAGDAGFADLTLDTNDDHVLLFSTGTTWRVVVNGIA